MSQVFSFILACHFHPTTTADTFYHPHSSEEINQACSDLRDNDRMGVRWVVEGGDTS